MLPLARAVATESPVESIDSGGGGGGSVRIRGGATLAARRGVIIAAEGPAAAHLLGKRLESEPSAEAEGVGTCCLYFTCAPGPFDPLHEPLLPPDELSKPIAGQTGCSLLLQTIHLLSESTWCSHLPYRQCGGQLTRMHHGLAALCPGIYSRRASCNSQCRSHGFRLNLLGSAPCAHDLP